MNTELLKQILGEKENENATDVFKRNVVKEYFQILALSFIYSRKEYQNLIFYGGSCLKHCFGLPRLSEDLDFIDLTGKIDLSVLSDDLKIFFKKEIGTEPISKPQSFRVYLKFPILRQLGLVSTSDSDLLNIKVEVFKKFDFCGDYKIEIVPIFKDGKSILVRTLDMSSLMSTKIGAVLSRKWEKKNKEGKILAKVKGRDYFDLMWYLEKGIKPNLACIGGNFDKEKLKNKLLEIVNSVDVKSISFDLESLISDRVFIKNISKNIKDILIKQINEKL